MASQQAVQKSIEDLEREVLRLERMKVGIEASLVNAKIALYAAQGKPSPLLPITAAMFSGTQTSSDAHQNSGANLGSSALQKNNPPPSRGNASNPKKNALQPSTMPSTASQPTAVSQAPPTQQQTVPSIEPRQDHSVVKTVYTPGSSLSSSASKQQRTGAKPQNLCAQSSPFQRQTLLNPSLHIPPKTSSQQAGQSAYDIVFGSMKQQANMPLSSRTKGKGVTGKQAPSWPPGFNPKSYPVLTALAKGESARRRKRSLSVNDIDQGRHKHARVDSNRYDTPAINTANNDEEEVEGVDSDDNDNDENPSSDAERSDHPSNYEEVSIPLRYHVSPIIQDIFLGAQVNSTAKRNQARAQRPKPKNQPQRPFIRLRSIPGTTALYSVTGANEEPAEEEENAAEGTDEQRNSASPPFVIQEGIQDDDDNPNDEEADNPDKLKGDPIYVKMTPSERHKLELTYCVYVSKIISSKTCVAMPPVPHDRMSIKERMERRFGILPNGDERDRYRTASDFEKDAERMLKDYIRLGSCKDCPFNKSGTARFMCYRMRLTPLVEERMAELQQCLKEADLVDGRLGFEAKEEFIENWFHPEDFSPESHYVGG
ncbi:hypothetical protein LTR05_007834 [Lithohypha guttulata]|uniref:Uncharacterized protein n=1 Tax=Lithohypha guttulata TaxID=1690604 RepID=A0AAN7Y426_9EURO|nr:hypothetical protein LTR05_007834 [Lithohypha guttulata]